MEVSTSRALNNGVQMPNVGLGVWRAEGNEAQQAALWALEEGYRLIDTAALYGNEAEVGRAVRQSGLPRQEIFVTTKLWNADQLNGTQHQAFEKSVKALDLGPPDLYLLHWPVPGKYKESWKFLEELYESGKVRAIGVSNFHVHHLEDLLADAKVKPALNQVELHPHLNQSDLLAFCTKQGIALQAWRPLGGGKSNLLRDETIGKIAAAHGKTHAQVILRWNLQRGVMVIPKSVHKDRIHENFQLFDFALTEKEMAAITAMHQGVRYGEDPDAMQNVPKLMEH